MVEPPPSGPRGLPEGLIELIKPELEPGEQLLWAGRGCPRGRAAVAPPSPLALFFVGAALLSAGSVFLALLFRVGAFGRFVFDPKEQDSLLIAGVSAGTIGLVLMVLTFAHWRSHRSGRDPSAASLYALTDRRAIIWKPRLGTEAVEIHSSFRGRFQNVHRVEYPDGSGDVIFEGADVTWDARKFEGIAEVRRVEDLVRRTLIVPVAEPGA